MYTTRNTWHPVIRSSGAVSTQMGSTTKDERLNDSPRCENRAGCILLDVHPLTATQAVDGRGKIRPIPRVCFIPRKGK